VAAGPPAAGDIRFEESNGHVVYSATDVLGNPRFLGDTDLGVSSFYPARIETSLDGGAQWIEFYCTDAGAGTTEFRAQPTSSIGSNSWPPEDGADVTVFPAAPRMRTLMAQVLSAAFSALGWTGSKRRIDKLLVWPTEADINYAKAYANRDFDFILSFLAAYLTVDTDILLTLPWPYAVGKGPVRGDWWDTIRDLVSKDPDRRTLISLSNSGPENWGDTNNIHVLDAGRELIGNLMRKSEMTGGTSTHIVLSGVYTPLMTPVANVTAVAPSEAIWSRVGKLITVSGVVNIRPTAAATTTEVGIPLPVPSNIATHFLSGQATTDAFADHSGTLIGNPANNTARLRFISRGVVGSTWSYTFTYRVRDL